MFSAISEFLAPYKLWLYLVISVVIFGAGWQVNGWRLNAKIEKQKVVLAEKETTIKLLSSAIEIQNTHIANLGIETEAAKRRGSEASKKAEAISKQASIKINRLQGVTESTGDTCDGNMDYIKRLLDAAR